MGKSPSAGCLRIMTFGQDSKNVKTKRNGQEEGELQMNASKRRWSFRKRASHLRVLRTTVANEPLYPNTEGNEKGLVFDQDKQAMPVSAKKVALSMLMEQTSVNVETTVTPSTSERSVSGDVDSSHDAYKNMEVTSAIKIQAAIRAYLARRTLCHLKGIVRLQAHVRGQLVRKQAARTLRCVQAIIRLQAVVRARRVRLSEQGLAIQERLELIRLQNGSDGRKFERNSSIASLNNNSVLAGKLFANGFARQLLETVPKADSLHIEYDPDDSNSGWKWLERWMAASPGESNFSAQPKIGLEHKDQTEKAGFLEVGEISKELNLKLVPNLDQAEVEAEKQNFILMKESDSTSNSTSETIQSEDGSNMHSLKVPKSISDSIADRLSKHLKQVSSSDLSKHDVQNEDCNSSSREVSTSLLDFLSNQHETKSGKGNDNLRNVQYSKCASVSDKSSIQLRNLFNSILEPVLDQSRVEPVHSEVTIKEKTHSTVHSCSDETKVECDNCTCSVIKAPKSTFESISDKSSFQLRNLFNSILEPVLDQSQVESDHSEVTLKPETHSTMDSCSNETKVEGDNCTCSSIKAPKSSFELVSYMLEPGNEISAHNVRRMSDFIPDSVSVQPNTDLKEDSNATTDSLDYVKDENEISKCSSRSNSTRDLLWNQQKVEVENSHSSFRDALNSTLNFELDTCEAKTGDPDCRFEEISNLTLHSVPVQAEAEAEAETEKCGHDSKRLSTSKLDTVMDHPKVVKKFMNAAFESNSELLKGESEKIMSGPAKMADLPLRSVSDDTSMQPEKVSNSVIDSVSNQPRNALDQTFSYTSDQLHSPVEAENPKYNMDKLSSSIIDSVSDQLEAKVDKLMSSSTEVSALASDSDAKRSLSGELHRMQETDLVVEGTSPIQLSAGSLERSDDSPPQQSLCGESIPSNPDKVESSTKNNSENSVIDMKAARKRNSISSGKSDHSPSDSQGCPSVPNYMAATMSAKAKLRPHSSPKSSPDVLENATNAKRRNSLPGSRGQQQSVSPRRSLSHAQKTTNGNSVLSPRDSTEKQKQEWRR